MFDYVAEVKTLSVQSMIGWWCDYGGVSLVRSWWPNLDLCWSAQPPPPATNTLSHQTSRRCYQGISSIFYLAYLWTIFHTHTHNLKADINAVMVFVCVVIFPTVVHHLS